MKRVVIQLAEDKPLPTAIAVAFGDARREEVDDLTLVLPRNMRPTIDLVEAVVSNAAGAPMLGTITLVHPSAAIGFLVSSIALRLPTLQVRSTRSLEEAGATPGSVPRAPAIHMRVGEKSTEFVRRSLAEMRERVLRSAILVFSAASLPEASLQEVLVDELLQSGGVRSIALVHPSVAMDVVAASVRLRLPRTRIIPGTDVAAAEIALAAL